MNTIKIWFDRIIRSRTMHAANILAILGVVQANSDFLSSVLTPSQFGWMMMAIGIVFAVLRAKTTTALVDK